MDWKDFIEHFDDINVCQRSKGLHDLYIDLQEGDGCFTNLCGPTQGCAWGCCKFWCMCKARGLQRQPRTPWVLVKPCTHTHHACASHSVTGAALAVRRHAADGQDGGD